MNEETIHDDILFDRLVDGELSDDERRRLLASLDGRVDGWRRCALAFLEAQSWSSDLGLLLRPRVPASSDAIESVTLAPGHSKPRRQRLAWLAVAASVLVAATLVMMQGDGGNRMATMPRDANEQIAVATPPNPAPDTAAVNDALTLWVRDDNGQSRPVRVPLVDAGALDRELGVTFQSAISPEIRERLQERGYDLQSRRRYAPLWLENGRPMIVPVEDTKIVPVGRKVY
jgi:hypothetical protein